MGIAQRTKSIRSNKTSDRLRGSVNSNKSDRRGSDFEYNKKLAKERDDYTCQRCGASNPPDAPTDVVLTVDHKVVSSKGGSNSLSNLITLCNFCHAKKPGKANKRGASLLRALKRDVSCTGNSGWGK